MAISSKLLLTTVLSTTLLLAACDSSEERAEGHFENAVDLLEDGDVDRALVELRNVFQLNEDHIRARKLFAETMLERGDFREAFGNFLYVSERDPNDLEARKALATMAFELRNWDELERHATAAAELAPQDPEVQLSVLANRFRNAVADDDSSERREVIRQVEALRQELGESLMSSRMIIDSAIRDQELSTALREIDIALTLEPDSDEFLQLRLATLARLGNETEVEDQLVDLVDRFPENSQYRETLLRWFLSRGQPDLAEDLLRAAATGDSAVTQDRVALVQFIQVARGREAAIEEISTLEALGQDTEVLRALRAGLTFDLGDRDAAIAEMNSIVDVETTTEIIRDIKVSLSQMLTTTGNLVAARQRIEEVLSEDPGHVEALKVRAGWFVDQDEGNEAIIALRRALDQAPRDPEIMTLMARAHLRNGERELAGEMLSLAVDNSNRAPEESVRYARFLIEEESLSTAEAVLIDSLRISPNTLEILLELGRVYIAQEDWGRAEQVEGSLSRLGTEQGEQGAAGLRVARLNSQDRGAEVVGFLESIIEQQGASAQAELAIVRTHLRNGDSDAALQFVSSELEEDPSNRLMRFLQAGIFAGQGESEPAEAIYRDLLDENADGEAIWRSLYLLQIRDGRFEEARVTLQDGITANEGRSQNLQWALAGEFERNGEIDDAIAIYEVLYEENSNSVVVANNLASLITTYRDDEANLDRAFTIARRLRGLDQPAFQDTYGWIALRRGDLEEALEHLVPAAQNLPGDPLVQYHLAVAYEQSGRVQDAIDQFRRAVEIAGPADTRPQIETARSEIARLESLPVEQ